MSKNKFFDIDPEEFAKLTKVAKPLGSNGEPLTIPLLEDIERNGLRKAKAKMWNKTTAYVSRASELTLEELSRKFDLPIRRTKLEVSDAWNTAMITTGMIIALLPKDWEREVRKETPEKTLEAFLDYVCTFLTSRS